MPHRFVMIYRGAVRPGVVVQVVLVVYSSGASEKPADTKYPLVPKASKHPMPAVCQAAGLTNCP